MTGHYFQRHGPGPGIVFAITALSLLFVAGSGQAFETVSCQLANGFDYPVGKPDASGYYKARGFWPNGHLGEDWNGRAGGDQELGDPVFAIGGGVVVLSEDVKLGWGNCIIIRHIFREPSGKIEMVDSLYGHLLERKVKVGDKIERGQQVGRMGSNNGMYPAHLHLEVRKNLAIGMNRTKFARDYSNYYSPTAFIQGHRQLAVDIKKYDMPMNTFAPHGQDLNNEQIAFANSRGTSASSGSSSGSGRGSKESTSSTTVKKTSGGLSIPLTTTSRGTGSSKESTIPKVTEKKKPDAAPDLIPPSEPKEDFWSRLKSKVNSGQVTDPKGDAP
ncbi:MAG: M23 family metallopeptidase [Verrucomicrobia bacterium]|nr:M23 family metallopeptidase [Verrucomicrobiota bacterium]